jgi:hypothetical protein
VYKFDFFIDTIQIEYEGAECLNFPSSVLVPADTKNYEVTINLKPVEEGVVKLTGMKVRFLNFEHLHRIDERGGVPAPYFDLWNIQIIEELPEVSVSIYRESADIQGVEAVRFDESEIFTLNFIVKNLSHRRVENVRMELCVESENPPIYECRHLLKLTCQDSTTLDDVQLDEFS